MLLHVLGITLTDISVKIVRENLDAIVILLLYKTLLLVCILPWVLSKGLEALKTKELSRHFFRSFFSFMAAWCYFQGLKYVPVADAAALENMKGILVIAVGVIFFSEKLNTTKALATITAFIGALIVVNPGFVSGSAAGFNANHYLILAAVFFWTLNTIIIKVLGRGESQRTQMFYVSLFSAIFALPALIFDWKEHSMGGMMLSVPCGLSTAEINLMQYLPYAKYFFFMAFCYFIHGIAFFQALKGELSTVIPLRYTKLLFSAFFGYLILGENVILSAVPGYILIIVGSLLIIRYEIKKVKVDNDGSSKEKESS